MFQTQGKRLVFAAGAVALLVGASACGASASGSSSTSTTTTHTSAPSTPPSAAPRFFGHRGGFAPSGRPFFPISGTLSAAAQALHLPEATLRQDLLNGQSLDQVATAQHVPISTLQQALEQQMRQAIQSAPSASPSGPNPSNFLSRYQAALPRLMAQPGWPVQMRFGPRGAAPSGSPPNANAQ
ncbi:MAG: hypothetical protein K6U87_12545 [Firmicutes bacterium]|nr:hypothetical protein [Bacillota bacterium]